MKVLATVLVCGVSIAALGTSSAEAQTTESRLQQVTYMHISPGQTQVTSKHSGPPQATLDKRRSQWH